MLNEIKETFEKRMSADADLRLFMDGELLSLLSSPDSENVLQGLIRLAESRGLISLQTFWPEDEYYYEKLHDQACIGLIFWQQIKNGCLTVPRSPKGRSI